MSGVYKLINLFLFLGFAGLLALLTHRVTRVQEVPELQSGPTPLLAAEAPASRPTPAPRAAGVQPSFDSYASVVEQNPFAADRKPWIESGPTPVPELTPEPTPQEDEEFDSRGLRLTGTVLLGMTKLAFFDEGSVQAAAAMAPGADAGALAGLSRAVAGGPGQSRLQQRLLEQQRRLQAAKIQEAIRTGQPVPGGLPRDALPGLPPGLAGSGAEAAGEGGDKPSAPRHGYREGAEVAGFKIEEIRAVEVVLSLDGRQGVLKLEEEAGAGPERAAPQRPQTRPGGAGLSPQQQLQEQQRRLREQQLRLREQQRRQQQLARRRARERQLARRAGEAGQPAVADVPPPEGEVLPEEPDLEQYDDEGYLEDEEFIDEELEPPDAQPGSPVKLTDEK
jgi:hypothetical protein